MISVTSAQLDAWLAAFLFPLARILGLLSATPVFNNAAMPRRVRLVAGLALSLVLVPALPPIPPIPGGSWIGFIVLAQQILIGLLMGFTLRIVFVAVDLAGELIGLQMGLSFAMFYDPQRAAQTPVVSELLGLLATLLFLAMNGHLLMLSALAQSFTVLPISTTPIAANGLMAVVAWAAMAFSAGVLLALPLVTALLIANIAMGILARVAPQLNLFSVGFPVTILTGFAVLAFSLPYMGSALGNLFDQGFQALRNIMQAAMPAP